MRDRSERNIGIKSIYSSLKRKKKKFYCLSNAIYFDLSKNVWLYYNFPLVNTVILTLP